ncbi:ABC transporter permease [Curtobacterium sp. MCBD17_034]|uniref:ABC transporter permease n=1 Tax=unclassified Curtobacterium TaxID=257496 RepID=UPI000DA94F46|nr:MULTISPECIES: ABC transporter permease [unclassified Curtobacterium]PZF58539.1 ABC transporter permease [Curtobacterium sp. MCBD17_034]PZF64412.1 ABC transporter permease [Curtobacterium sp. MCBD17_013]PZM34528.1 ABC transporter permease [Curtobacterium sp. MCBD17_031]WIE53600.1 ABC transporter permease [Curtobacterium sp. MCBD17_003]
MSVLAPNATAPAASAADRPVTAVRSWKAPIGYGVFTLFALVLFGVFHKPGTSTFELASAHDLVQLPAVPLPATGTGIVVIVLLAIGTAYATWRAARSRKVQTWVTVLFAIAFVIAFLTWASPGSTIPVPGLLVGALGLSAPLIFGSLGGVISERVGVVNIAIEGQFLAGAFASAVVASITGSAWVGLVAAVIAGVLVSFILAAFSIKYLVDQVIVGVVINAFVSGLTGFLYSKVLATDTALNVGVRFPAIEIPGLSAIPIIGPVFFHQSVIVYLMYIAVAAVTIGLFTTRWGLRLRAVGEHPQAADTVGINVTSTRFWNVSLAGAIAGLGGAYFTLGNAGPFAKDMTAGAGYIALAAVIFGRWDPIKATLAALLFGFASNLQNLLAAIHSPVPTQFLLMLPYVVTIFAVAGLVGQSRGPAASGKPYIKS